MGGMGTESSAFSADVGQHVVTAVLFSDDGGW